MPRLRRADCSSPGITRVRRGKGFSYLDEDGDPIDEPDVVERIRSLGIPPAWKDVWICPYPMGHIQATGIDAAGRKQYLYHPEWRRRRDLEKFDEMLAFARSLPQLRERVAADLRSGDDLTRERVLACAVRLLDRGFFRIGTEEYAAANESFGLATMKKAHVRVEEGSTMVFDYPAKHGKRRVQAVVDPLVCDIVARLKRRRGGGPELLAFKAGGRWRDIKSGEINAYLKEVTGANYSAKDFRTWNATVLAAVALAVAGEVAHSKTGRQRAIVRAVKEVAHYLGNTPAVCRASYIDPRVFDAYEGGLIIRPVLEAAADTPEGELPIHQRAVEEAVLDLIDERSSAPGVEKIAA
jgi:DNA topoisomerase IB